jgi:hypothetical protein
LHAATTFNKKTDTFTLHLFAAIYLYCRLASTIIIEGLPVITQERQEKLLTVICKYAAKKGVELKPEMLEIPYGESGKSSG